MSKLQKKPSALKRGHPTLQNMNFYKIFLLLRVVFALLDPDWDFKSGSNPDSDSIRILIPDPIRIRIQSGSGTATLPLGSGSGSGRPKNMWIRIRNTALCPCFISPDEHQTIVLILSGKIPIMLRSMYCMLNIINSSEKVGTVPRCRWCGSASLSCKSGSEFSH